MTNEEINSMIDERIKKLKKKIETSQDVILFGENEVKKCREELETLASSDAEQKLKILRIQSSYKADVDRHKERIEELEDSIIELYYKKSVINASVADVKKYVPPFKGTL